MEKYSVLMAVYEKEKPQYLAQSLKSMFAQTAMPDEVVLVEDGPLNDGLCQVVRKYQEKYPHIMKVAALPRNVGLGKALNYGLALCSNELVARMDSDDISLPARCEMQLRMFARFPQLAIVGTQVYEFTGSPGNVVSARIVPAAYIDILRFSRRRSPFNHPTVMFRKTAVHKAGGYGAYRRKQDLDLFIRMLQKGFRAANLRHAYLLYRMDAANLMRRKNWGNCRDYIRIMYGFHKNGYNSVVDMAYVVAGQLAIYLMPRKITNWLSRRFLRKVKGRGYEK